MIYTTDLCLHKLVGTWKVGNHFGTSSSISSLCTDQHRIETLRFTGILNLYRPVRQKILYFILDFKQSDECIMYYFCYDVFFIFLGR